MSDDRKTDPDPRNPYEHVLSELNAIRDICQATHDRVVTTANLAVFATFTSLAALFIAACSYAH